MKINVSEILEKFMLTPAPCGYEAEMAYAMKSYFESGLTMSATASARSQARIPPSRARCFSATWTLSA